MGRNGSGSRKIPFGEHNECDEHHGKATAEGLNGLLTKPPKRHADGGGLFLKTLGQGGAYWT
jgi:hypothetical protein